MGLNLKIARTFVRRIKEVISRDGGEVFRYIVNGLVATAAHFTFLSILIEFLQVESAGLANLMAAALSIGVSFLGSRYFVFKNTQQPWYQQASKFVLLYAGIALVHGAVMWLWSDHFGFDYRLGFLVATCFQVAGSYLGNKFLVFSSK